MKHSNRDDMQKIPQQVVQPVAVKQKSSLFHRFKVGCCLVFVAGLIAGGLYLYKFYQDVKAEIDVEINQGKELYDDTKETIEKANENYQEINAAVEEGKEYLDKAEELKDKIDGEN